jgi:pimeloyl-ACP methyl ester carboxylesterase
MGDGATPDLRRVEVNGVRLAYEDLGEGPAILFIHGFMLDRTMWRDQVAALKGWRRIAPDLRGHGLSEAPERGYCMAAYANDLAAMLDALGIRRTVLCGVSMGGYIAFEFLRRHRERVAGLVIMDARSEADAPERRARRDVMIARALDSGSKAFTDELAPKFLAESAPEEMKKQLREMMERTPPNGMVGALEAMRDRPDSTPLLRTLASVPTLLLIGECDARTPRAPMQAMADQISGAKFNIVPDAGHVPPFENPAAVNSKLREFLAELSTEKNRSRS